MGSTYVWLDKKLDHPDGPVLGLKIDDDLYTEYLQPGVESDQIFLRENNFRSAFVSFTKFFILGIQHIVPKGLDHILFIFGLFLFSSSLNKLIKQITIFTIAHSITLIFVSLSLIKINPHIVDVDIDSPMSEEEIKRLHELEGILRESFLISSKIEWKLGRDLSKVKTLGEWKKDECFIVKTGKNKGNFEKKPKFDKWLKYLITS